MISNTDREDDIVMHWWSILSTSPKSELLFFCSFRRCGMKIFIVIDDKKTVGKVLKGLEAADREDDKLALIKLISHDLLKKSD